MIEQRGFIGTKASVSLFLDNVIGALLGWSLQMFLSRVLGPTGYGQYSLVNVIFLIFASFLTPGIMLAAERVTAMASHPQKAFLSVIRIEILVDIIVYFLYFTLLNFICQFLNVPDLYTYCLLLGLMIMPHGLASVTLGYLRGRLDFLRCFKIDLCYHLAKVLFCIALILLGYGLLGVVIGLMIGELAFFVSSLWSVKIKRNKEMGYLQDIIKMSVPFLLVGISALIMFRIDILCIRYFLSDYNSLGYYAAAARFGEVLSVLLSSTYVYLLPVLSKALNDQNYLYAQQSIERSVRYCFILAVPLCSWIAINSKIVMSLAFSYRFTDGAGVLTILSLGWMPLSILYAVNYIVSARGKLWFLFKVSAIFCLLNLILNILFIPRFGIQGVSVATIVSLLSMQTLIFIYNYKFKIFPTKKILWLPMRTFLNVAIATAIAIGVANLLFHSIIWQIFILKTISVAVFYIISLFLLHEINHEDKRIIDFLLTRIMERKDANKLF